MSDAAAFSATYHNIKVIHGRGVCQIILETPIEHWTKVNDVLGPPKAGEDTWVAVARIEPPGVEAR